VYVLNPSQLQYAAYASEVVVDGCDFTNATGAGLYDRVDSLSPMNGGTTAVSWSVHGSRFERLTGAGFRGRAAARRRRGARAGRARLLVHGHRGFGHHAVGHERDAGQHERHHRGLPRS